MMPVFVENALPWVWRASWQGAVLVGLILAVQILAGRRLSPQWRYALWWARKRSAMDREQACDATVLGWLRGDDQAAYGHTMLDLMQRFGAVPWGPVRQGYSKAAAT